MPITRTKPEPRFREQIFGFLLSEELMRERPEVKSIEVKHPEVTEKERRRFERRLYLSLA